jgi:peptidase M28-like protein
MKPTAVFGVLPGATDENVLVLAHTDALFQGVVDNASGVAVMLGLAEHFAKVPRVERRRTMTFVAPVRRSRLAEAQPRRGAGTGELAIPTSMSLGVSRQNPVGVTTKLSRQTPPGGTLCSSL